MSDTFYLLTSRHTNKTRTSKQKTPLLSHTEPHKHGNTTVQCAMSEHRRCRPSKRITARRRQPHGQARVAAIRLRQKKRAEVQVVDGQRSMLVIKSAIVSNPRRGVVDLPVTTFKAVHSFVMPNGYRREGARERLLMYLLGINRTNFCELCMPTEKYSGCGYPLYPGAGAGAGITCCTVPESSVGTVRKKYHTLNFCVLYEVHTRT